MPFHAAPVLRAPMPGNGSLALGADIDGGRARTVPAVFVGRCFGHDPLAVAVAPRAALAFRESWRCTG
jgi:hypothetical protein